MIPPFQDFHMHRQKSQKDQYICLSYILAFQNRYLIVKILYYISGFLASPISICKYNFTSKRFILAFLLLRITEKTSHPVQRCFSCPTSSFLGLLTTIRNKIDLLTVRTAEKTFRGLMLRLYWC